MAVNEQVRETLAGVGDRVLVVVGRAGCDVTSIAYAVIVAVGLPRVVGRRAVVLRIKDPVTIRVVEFLGVSPSWKVSGNSDAFEKKSSDEIEFRIPLKPGEERKFAYTATYPW